MSKIIGLILALITIIGASYGVQNYFVTKAEAEEIMVNSERGNIETELKLIELELELLAERNSADLPEKQQKRDQKREEYLEHRQKILEERLLDLKDK
jgi:hypothetical protein